MTLFASHVEASLDVPTIRRGVDECLSSFLDGKLRDGEAGAATGDLVRVLRGFLFAGGKRIRPVLCAIGWVAAGGAEPPPPEVLRVAASLEMFHAFALIHDDVMDHSDTRRGHPTAHRSFAALHRLAHRPDCAAAEDIGQANAVLLGDLALVWSAELVHSAGLDPGRLVALLPLVDLMRAEVMRGQFLDVQATGHLSPDVAAALTTIRYKTAKYTYERPLHIGATMAGAAPALLGALSQFAVPLGEAFQLRDDLLGVFGDPRSTGKSDLDDLRSGKNTVLTALAVRRATPAQLRVLHGLIGRPDLDETAAGQVRAVFAATGARDTVEEMITDRRAQALAALESADLPPAASAALRQVADAAVRRSS